MATPRPQECLHLKDGAGDYLHIAWLLVVRPYTTVTCEMHLSNTWPIRTCCSAMSMDCMKDIVSSVQLLPINEEAKVKSVYHAMEWWITAQFSRTIWPSSWK